MISAEQYQAIKRGHFRGQFSYPVFVPNTELGIGESEDMRPQKTSYNIAPNVQKPKIKPIQTMDDILHDADGAQIKASDFPVLDYIGEEYGY